MSEEAASTPAPAEEKPKEEAAAGGGGGGDDAPHKEEESTAHFEPVVRSLKPMIFHRSPQKFYVILPEEKKIWKIYSTFTFWLECERLQLIQVFPTSKYYSPYSYLVFSLFRTMSQVQLEEVEVKTGEEEEVRPVPVFVGCVGTSFEKLLTLCCLSSYNLLYYYLQEVLHDVRGKLFVYGETMLNVGTGNKTWNERGIGQCKFLRHREHQKIRVLMRQEKTMKVICNHLLDPRLHLEPNVGSDRSWVWSAFDFAEGELTETVFALRFKSPEEAGDFKEKFEKLQKEMESLLAGEDKPDEDGKADEAAAAISNLTTEDKEESKE